MRHRTYPISWSKKDWWLGARSRIFEQRASDSSTDCKAKWSAKRENKIPNLLSIASIKESTYYSVEYIDENTSSVQPTVITMEAVRYDLVMTGICLYHSSIACAILLCHRSLPDEGQLDRISATFVAVYGSPKREWTVFRERWGKERT